MALFQKNRKGRASTDGDRGNSKQDRKTLTSVIGEEQLTAFPNLISEALRKIAEPEFDLNEIADLLMKDPGVTARLLGLVNSAALSRGRPVASVHQAVVIVGRNQLESLLISLAVKGALPTPDVPGFDRRRFWTTAARRASVAGQLATVVDPSKRSENFTAALLQDMALPVLAQRTAGYSETLLNWHASPLELSVLERECFGWDHGEIASLMASAWDFPSDLVTFLDGHHSIGADTEALMPAKLVAPIRESDAAGDEQVLQLASETYSIPAEQMMALVAAADEETTRLAALFT